MEVIIIFKEKNVRYSQEYADQYQFGRESVNNMKDNFAQSSKLSIEIDDVSFSSNDDYYLIGTLENGKSIDMILPNVATLKCIKDSEVVGTYGISKDLLEKTHKAYNQKYNTMRFYFYIRPDSDYTFITSNLCILKSEVPEDFFQEI